MVEDPHYKPSDTGFNLGINFGASFTYYQQNPNAPRGFEGFVQAWDPVAGKQVWRGESNQGPTGSVLATAGGLVFQGGGSSQEFRAYDAKTGAKLWSMSAQTAVLAGPISYELDGKQYIAVNVGGNQQGGYYAPNYSRLLVFALGGKAQLPPNKEYVPPPLDPPPATAAAAVVESGRSRYSQYCAICHGEEGQARGNASPDLTRSAMLHSQEAFDAVVLTGALVERGMGNFSDSLTAEDTQAIRAFIIARANELKNAPPAPPFGFGAPPPAQPAQQRQQSSQPGQVEQPHVEQ
jgi:alcohol dehydrogenase (cytochrome c)/quinohemoprotein ethanol dehydrogenase